MDRYIVRLPVRTTLLQNNPHATHPGMLCDYQSERHCSKTRRSKKRCMSWCDYQSERHCSKTDDFIPDVSICAITSQNDTAPKLSIFALARGSSAITSQNDTAPKQQVYRNPRDHVRLPVRTTLLQNYREVFPKDSLVRLPVRTTLLQNSTTVADVLEQCDYQSERHCSKTKHIREVWSKCAITSQNDTAPKRQLGRGER